jgi:hypothetical protein
MSRADASKWVMPAVVVLGGFFVLRQLQTMFKGGTEAAKQAGEKLSQTAFDLLHPELSKEEYNKPTVLKATVVKRQQGTTTWNAYTCPSGYRYKKTAQGEHLCFRE